MDESPEEEDEADAGGPSEEEVRSALRDLKSGAEPSLRHVLILTAASYRYAIPIVPKEAVDAVEAKWAIDRDLANGGMDQVVWNSGHEVARQLARALRAVGAIENADLIDRLCGALEEYRGSIRDADISADPVKQFLAFRKAVGGPFFGIPEPAAELAEALLEFVLERAAELPDPAGALPARAQ